MKINEQQWDGKFAITKLSQGISILSITVPEGDYEYPLIIDPVAIDSAATATGTAYGNGRKILRDAWGNLIAVFDGDTTDHIWYKNYNATSWTDAGIDLVGATDNEQDLAADIDSTGNVHMTFSNGGNLSYREFTVTRNSNNQITGISEKESQVLDNSNKANRPSLIIANKGEGPGKEKIAVAWAMNSTAGGTKRGEIRFLQCDVADNCATAANWKNASEEKNGSGTCADTGTGNVGLPNAIDCKGASDALFNTGAHTTHHTVLAQVPGRPARTPTGAFKDINGTLTNLTNAIDDNPGTTADINSLTTTDYLYVGDTTKFSRIVNDITNTNANAQTFTTKQYCSANSDVTTTCDTWSSVSNFIDNTAGGITYSEDGSILFDEPGNWVESTEGPGGATVKGFWVRLRPGGAFDATVSIAEIDITDRHSKDLLVIGGVDTTDDLGAAYVVWDFVGQAGWENNPGSAGDPWRSDPDELSDTGGNWGTFTNFPLTATVDFINNAVYVAYVDDLATDVLTVKRISNNLTLAAAGTNWPDTSFPAVTEAADIVLSLTSDQSDIYLFYILDPGTNNLVWRKCTPSGGGDGNTCDNSADWGSENTLVVDSTLSHPQAIVSKAFGDTVAIDIVYTDTTDLDVLYERHFVNMADITEVVAASGDDAYHRDCDSGTDDQDITATTVKLGRDVNDTGCSPTTVESTNHGGFRFSGVNVAQGAAISSAYLDFRVNSVTAGAIGLYTSISCPTADDCKIVFYDDSNDDLLFFDCDNATCSSGTTTLLDGAPGCVLTSCSTTTNVGSYTSISCPTATDCKISYLDLGNGDLKFADCDTATCSSGTATTVGVSMFRFTIYGEDVDSGVTDGTVFDALTDCTDPCSGSIRTLTRTTSSVGKAIDVKTQSYRIDVTDIIQEIVCRGAANSQPCVGNFNGAGTWAANNNIALLLISADSGSILDNYFTITAQDDTATTMLDPTLQINCVGPCNGTTAGKNYSMGVDTPPTGSSDLDHPVSSIQFGQINTDDTLYASVAASMDQSASSSASPIFMLKVNNSSNTNTQAIRATAIVKTSQGGAHARSPIHLQVYRGGSYNGWITLISTSTNIPGDTDITLDSGPILTSITDYYQAEPGPNLACSSSSANCWVYFRIYQDPPTDNYSEILYLDYFNVTFGSVSDTFINTQIKGGTKIRGGSRIQ